VEVKCKHAPPNELRLALVDGVLFAHLSQVIVKRNTAEKHLIRRVIGGEPCPSPYPF